MNPTRKQAEQAVEQPTKEIQTFQALCEAWMKKKKIKIKYPSYVKYAYLLNQYILAEMGDIPVAELDVVTVEQRLANLYYSQGKEGMSKSLMKSILFIVNSVIEHGAHMGYCRSFKALFELPVLQTKRLATLTAKEQATLVKYLSHNRSSNHLGILLSLFTGMRLGEVCALQRQNIDLENGVLYVRSTVQRIKKPDDSEGTKTELMLFAPKSSNSCREIPIPSFLCGLLAGYGLSNLRPLDYVLSRDELPYEPRRLQNGFKRALKRCNLPDINYHATRHTFATYCVKLGFDVKALSEILGHASVNFTLNRYVHSDFEHKKSQMALLSDGYKKLKDLS